MSEDYRKALETLLDWHRRQVAEYKHSGMMSMAELTWGEVIHNACILYIKGLLKDD